MRLFTWMLFWLLKSVSASQTTKARLLNFRSLCWIKLWNLEYCVLVGILFYKSWFNAGVENVKDLLETMGLLPLMISQRNWALTPIISSIIKWYINSQNSTRNYVRLPAAVTALMMQQPSTPHKKIIKKVLQRLIEKTRPPHLLRAKVNGWPREEYLGKKTGRVSFKTSQ